MTKLDTYYNAKADLMHEIKKPKDPTTLYYADNGRINCWKHLGMTAKSTGFDLDGEPIVKVEDADRKEWIKEFGSMECESCAYEAKRKTEVSS